MIAAAAEVAALGTALEGASNTKIQLAELRQMWGAAASHRVGDVSSTRALRDALDRLAAAGRIELPSKASWDNQSSPPLPKFVRVPANRTSRRPQQWKTYPWRPELAWAASARTLSDSQFEQLQAINRWLGTRSKAEKVPSRLRSAEIFGDEKRLEQMENTALFAEGRLTLELLRCVRRYSPVTAVKVGSGPDVLVTENADPYWALHDLLTSERSGPPSSLLKRVGVVIFGHGRAFPPQVRTLVDDVAGTGPVRGTVWYWGDADPQGVKIMVDAGASAAVAGIDFRPAGGLWQAMVSSGVTTPIDEPWPALPGCPSEIEAMLSPLRETQCRAAQEAVGLDALRAVLAAPQ